MKVKSSSSPKEAGPPKFSDLGIRRVRLTTEEERKSIRIMTYPDLHRLTQRVVQLYNDKLSEEDQGEGFFLCFTGPPDWNPKEHHRFCFIAYEQIKRRKTCIKQALTALDPTQIRTQGEDDTVIATYLLFFSRIRCFKGGQCVEESFALSTRDAYHLVQKISNYRFPKDVARRTLKKNLVSLTARRITGHTLKSEKRLKSSEGINSLVFLDRIVTKFTSPLQEGCSLLKQPCFQTKQKKEICLEVQPGVISFNTQFRLSHYPPLLDALSRMVRKPFEGSWWNYWGKCSYHRFTQLNRALKHLIWEKCRKKEWGGNNWRFCHPHVDDFVLATEVKLHVPKSGKPKVVPYGATLADIFSMLIKLPICKEKLENETAFIKFLDAVKVSFNVGKKRKTSLKDPLLKYIEMEFLFEGISYMHLGGLWFEAEYDFLVEFQQAFAAVLRSSLQGILGRKHVCSLPWPEEHKVEEKKKGEKEKRDIEFEYNCSYLKKKGYIPGDHVLARSRDQTFEFFDVIHFTSDTTYLFHVKKGFGNTRTSSQIEMAAKALRFDRAHVINQYWASLEKGSKEGAEAATGSEAAIRQNIWKKWKKLKKEGFANLLDPNKRKVVFVYAFYQEGARDLKDEYANMQGISLKEIQEVLSPNDRKVKGRAQAVKDTLVKGGWISSEGIPTGKLRRTNQKPFIEAFKIGTGKTKASLHTQLRGKSVVFGAFSAKQQIMYAYRKVTNWGFGFEICQIPAPGTSTSSDGKSMSPLSLDSETTESSLESILSHPWEEEECAREDAVEDVLKDEENRFWVTYRTVGDGACMQHAVRGKATQKGYFFQPDVDTTCRSDFCTKLRGYLEETEEETWTFTDPNLGLIYQTLMSGLIEDAVVVMKQAFQKAELVIPKTPESSFCKKISKELKGSLGASAQPNTTLLFFEEGEIHYSDGFVEAVAIDQKMSQRIAEKRSYIEQMIQLFHRRKEKIDTKERYTQFLELLGKEIDTSDPWASLLERSGEYDGVIEEIEERCDQRVIKLVRKIEGKIDTFSAHIENLQNAYLEVIRAIALQAIPRFLECMEKKKEGFWSYWFTQPEVPMLAFLYRTNIDLYTLQEFKDEEGSSSSTDEMRLRKESHTTPGVEETVPIFYNGINHYKKMEPVEDS